jgi:hypothetical protein
MICQVAFAEGTFRRLIAYRVVDRFRPPTSPVGHAPHQCWVDGVVVQRVRVAARKDDRYVLLNRLREDGVVEPDASGVGFNASALSIRLDVLVYLARLADVANAGTARPPTTSMYVPASIVEVMARLDVDDDGVPHLSLDMTPPPAVPPDVFAGVTGVTEPFPVGEALKGVLPPGRTQVLNAGLAFASDGAVLLRFELADDLPRPAHERLAAWSAFFAATSPSHLGEQGWAVALDGRAVSGMVAKLVDAAFEDRSPLKFSPGIGQRFSDGASPRATATKRGRILDACAGNDVRFDAMVHMTFSVPEPDVLRGRLDVDVDKNDWDVAKCFAVTVLNPLSILITMIDHGQTGLGVGLTILDMMVPVLKPVALGVALVGIIAGVDVALARSAVDSELEGRPELTRVDDAWVLDIPTALRTDLTADWLSLREALGDRGRLVLRGPAAIPAPVLPRVVARDIEGMSPWHLRDSCEPGRGQQTTGRAVLELHPGYRVEDGSPAPRRPTIRLRYVEPNGSKGGVYQVVGDDLGIYEDPTSHYTQIDYAGVPGMLSVKLREATVRKERYAAFADRPYGLRLRFFTNGGVREYVFAAPAKLSRYRESVDQAAERINRCKQLQVGVVESAYLELLWRVDPPDGFELARQWDIHLAGLEAGRTATAWDAVGGTALARGVADSSGRIDMTAITGPGNGPGLSSLVVTLGQGLRPPSPPPPASEGSAPRGQGDAGVVHAAVRQTTLSGVAHVDVGADVEGLEIEKDQEDRGRLLVVHADGNSRTVLPVDVPPGPVVGADARLRVDAGRLVGSAVRSAAPASPEAPTDAAASRGMWVAQDGLVVATDDDGVHVYRRGEVEMVTAAWVPTS